MYHERFVEVLGVRISRVNKNDVLSQISGALSGGSPITVFTPNPEIVMRAQKDKALKNALNSADLLLADGVGIMIASRLLGDPLPERITGIDTGELTLAYAAERGIPIFLLGAKHGVAERAAREIRARYSDIRIVGTHHGYFEKAGAQNDAVIQKINDIGAEVLIVCFGAPIQETWISENKKRLESVKLYLALGGALDVWAKDVRRAPKIFQMIGLEWLWRIIKEPRRAGFILKMPPFLCKVLCRKISN